MGFLSSNHAAKNGKSASSPPVQAKSSRMETVIGANSSMNGSLKADGDIRIDGAFEGEIEVLGNLIVGSTGRVVATVKASNIHVAGAVRGDVTAVDQLEISHSGKVWGNITASALHIEPGGMFRGQSVMQEADEPLLLEAPQAHR